MTEAQLCPAEAIWSPDSTRVVDSVTPDGAATADSLSWISGKALARDPNRWLGFKGALLILPHEASGAPTQAFAYARCTSPKLAFSLVVDRFFPDRARIRYPQGPSSVFASAQVAGGVELGPGVVLGDGVVLEAGVRVGPNSVLMNCRVGLRTAIGANCTIGLPGFGYEKDASGRYFRFPHLGGVVIGQDVEIGSNTCIDRGALGDTVVEDGAKIDNLVHIAHNVRVGRDAVVIANAMVGGSATLGAGVWVAPSVSIMNQASVGPGAVLGMGAVVLKNVEPQAVIVGNPGKPLEKKRA